jgi:hypothetical protein
MRKHTPWLPNAAEPVTWATSQHQVTTMSPYKVWYTYNNVSYNGSWLYKYSLGCKHMSDQYREIPPDHIIRVDETCFGMRMPQHTPDCMHTGSHNAKFEKRERWTWGHIIKMNTCLCMCCHGMSDRYSASTCTALPDNNASSCMCVVYATAHICQYNRRHVPTHTQERLVR